MNCLENMLGTWMTRIDLHLSARGVFKILCRLIYWDPMRLKEYSQNQNYAYFNVTIMFHDPKGCINVRGFRRPCKKRLENDDKGRWSFADTYVLNNVTE